MLTLASDFGSPYPAAMRGVALRECDARVVDVAHDLPRQDVRAAAFWLRFVLPEFPPAVHCAVVDPGVGTDRAAIAVRAGDHLLVGPDNGSLLPPARALATRSRERTSAKGDGSVVVYTADYDTPASTTFHGRDVFAPLAAAVHRAVTDETGWNPAAVETLGRVTRTDEYVDLSFPEPDPRDCGVDGEVLVVDGFGNVVTNVGGDALPHVDGDSLPPTATLTVNGERVPLVETFAAVGEGEKLVTVGSHGNAECDVNRGRGDEAFGLAPGDEVAFRWDA